MQECICIRLVSVFLISIGINNCSTDIDKDYTSVLNGVHCLSANWRKIGLSLGVSYNTVDAIEGERKKASDMLMDLLAVWLRRESEGQPKPTWKKLCEAVNTIDRTRAEVLAQEHQCDCPVCLGNCLILHHKFSTCYANIFIAVRERIGLTLE